MVLSGAWITPAAAACPGQGMRFFGSRVRKNIRHEVSLRATASLQGAAPG